MKHRFFAVILGTALASLCSAAHADLKKLNLPIQKPFQSPAVDLAKKKSEPKMIGLQLGEKQFVACENCGGKGGASQDIVCPEGQALADFENWVGQFGDCDSDWGGCMNHAIVGAAQFRCAEPQLDKVGPPSSYARTASGQSRVGVAEPHELDHWGDGCLYFSSLPYGIIGRGGERVDSFGLSCGSYFRTDSKPRLMQDSPKPTTYQCEDTKYGCSPGSGGAEFEAKCPADSVLVGLKVRAGNDVDGIEGIYCAPLLPIYPIFPVEE